MDHYVLHLRTMSPRGNFVVCSEDVPCFTDLQFWISEFLNVPCGDGLHFYSGFAVCLVVYVQVPCGVAIIKYK